MGPDIDPAHSADSARDWRETYECSGLCIHLPLSLPIRSAVGLGGRAEDGVQEQPDAPINHFYHVRRLTDATYRDGGSPNNDTLYSLTWVDVTIEPVILSHPEKGNRYFTFELAGLDSDNFAYVGSRTSRPGRRIARRRASSRSDAHA